MKNLYLFLITLLIGGFTNNLSAQTWVSFVTDASGDNTAGLDGLEAHYYYDAASDSIWFRIDVNNLTSGEDLDFGINVMINIPGASSSFNFWGAQNSDAYHKLVTVWVTGTPPSSYTGTIGVSDAAGVNVANYTSVHQNNISIFFDVPNLMVILGMKRMDLITDTEMGGNMVTLKTAVATGSSMFWGDDLYDANATITIDKGSSVGSDEIKAERLNIYPQPANDILTIEGHQENCTLQLINAAGQICLETNLSTGQNAISVAGVKPGVYLLKTDGIVNPQLSKIVIR